MFIDEPLRYLARKLNFAAFQFDGLFAIHFPLQVPSHAADALPDSALVNLTPAQADGEPSVASTHESVSDSSAAALSY
jgi:hypothetical protein